MLIPMQDALKRVFYAERPGVEQRKDRTRSLDQGMMQELLAGITRLA
jgi:hypothetical protein